MASRLAHAQPLAGYFLVSFGTLGMQYAFGPLYVELLDELQGSSEATALVGSLCVGLMDALGFVSGVTVLRFGSRRCCCAAAALTTLGWGCSALVSAPWQLLLTYSLFIGVGHSLALYSAIISVGRWFDRRLALAHALPNTGGALSPLLMGLLAPALFAAVGWRQSFLVLGAVNGAALLVAAWLLGPPPEGAAADALSKAAAPPPERDAGLCEVVRGRRLQLLCLALLCFGLGAWMMVVHIVRFAMDEGLSERSATRLLTFLSLGSASVRIPMAAFADCAGRRRAVCVALLVLAAAHLACAASAAARASPRFLAALAFCVGGFDGTVLSCAASLPAELLPPRHRRLAQAGVFSPIGVGFMAGPLIAAALRRATGDYAAAALVAAAFLGAGAALMGYLATLRLDGGWCPCGGADRARRGPAEARLGTEIESGAVLTLG